MRNENDAARSSEYQPVTNFLDKSEFGYQHVPVLSPTPQRARICVVPYRNRRRPHLKWTISGWYGSEKQRIRRFFKDKGEAETLAKQLRIKSDNLGTRATHIDPRLHVMAVECHEQLAPYGHTISDATKFYIEHLDNIKRSCAINELVTEFLQDKKTDGKRQQYLRDLRLRLGRFRKSFGDRIVATVTTRECDKWLKALGLSAQSRNNYRRVLSTFFAYAVAYKYCSDNPITETAEAEVVSGPIEILTPEQTQRLLDSSDVDVVPSVAIGAFAGLRAREISWLDWREVKIERGFIEVTAHASKTASRRLVAIQPNLKKWLMPHARPSGPVAPLNFRRKFDAARIRSGIRRWPPNALRHSFVSYWLAAFQDAPALALQIGHATTTVLFKHYREVVTSEAARSYWDIRPAP